MTVMKLFVFLLLLLCVMPVCSADNWFNATLSEQFDDAEEGAYSLAIAIVAIYILSCFILTIVGWKAHNKKLFKMGLEGFGILLLATIVYGFITGFFEYYVNKYW